VDLPVGRAHAVHGRGDAANRHTDGLSLTRRERGCPFPSALSLRWFCLIVWQAHLCAVASWLLGPLNVPMSAQTNTWRSTCTSAAAYLADQAGAMRPQVRGAFSVVMPW